jgi:hypothetical protein
VHAGNPATGRNGRGTKCTPGGIGRVALLGVVLLSMAHTTMAAVLPEDRADAMYHMYSGGGVDVNGPALLVRKSVNDKTSVAASYYSDSVSAASIDVLTTASPYHDKRDEYSVSADYIYRDSLMSIGYISSKESDYLADTYTFNIAQDYFAGLTTVSLGYTTGHDVVLKNTDHSFRETLDRYQFRLGISQIVTRNLITSLNYEAVVDDGYIANPYRAARLYGAFVPERYPTTRNSHAVSWQTKLGMDFFGRQDLRSSLGVNYRYYFDSWDMKANSLELDFNQYFSKIWLFDLHARYYSQSKAVFYSDNFTAPYQYMSRDKELSTFKDFSFGVKVTLHYLDHLWFLNKGTVSLAYDFYKFNYDDFTDVTTGQLYSFNAQTLQLMASFWY